MPRRLNTRRPAFTLIELMIASASSAILMGGLASALYISSRALLPDATATDERNRSALALAQMEADLRLALDFSERTATAVTLTVPDRNGDSQADTIRYSWTGTAGDPLLYQYNANTAVTVATNVQQFSVSALTRTIPADVLPATPASVVYESFAEAKANVAALTLTLPRPSGVAAGDLLIAVASVANGFSAPTMAAPAGWTLVSRLGNSSAVSGGVWWKIATASEPADYAFTWTPAGKAYGWVMRFSGASATTPIHAVATNVDASSSPLCPAVTTTMKNTMAVRIGAFDSSEVNVDNAGMAGYTTITVDRSDTGAGSASGGASRRALPVAGTSGTASFSLTGSQEYITFTIAIAPESG